MTTSHEKRRSRRVAMKGPARVVSIDGTIQELETPTRDMSVRGVFLYLSREVTPGTTLEIVIPLPDDISDTGEQWVRCQCRVVRVEQQTGKEFGVAAMIESIEPLAETPTANA